MVDSSQHVHQLIHIELLTSPLSHLLELSEYSEYNAILQMSIDKITSFGHSCVVLALDNLESLKWLNCRRVRKMRAYLVVYDWKTEKDPESVSFIQG